MALTRRKFVLASGGASLGIATSALGQQPITEFSTIKTELFFDIAHGRQNLITISTGTPGYPALEPRPDFGNIVFYWLVKMRSTSDEVGQNVRLWLFKPKAGRNPSLTPPAYGLGSGHFLLRYPSGDNTFPRKEDSQLWKDYIEPNWELAPGSHVTIDSGNFQQELAGNDWPGTRALAQWSHHDPGASPAFWPASGVPLRVATPGIEQEQLLMLLFELKRYGRLYLIARPMKVRPILYSGICATTAAYSPRSVEVATLRRWRDERLGKTKLGRVAIAAYYGVLSPSLVRFIVRSERRRRFARAFIKPFVGHASRQLQAS